IDLYTYYPYAENYCNSVFPILINLTKDEAGDFTIGGHGHSSLRLKYFSFSMNYDQTVLALAIPSAKPYTPLEKLYLPFKYKLWGMIIGILCASFILFTLRNIWKKYFYKKKFQPKSQSPYFNMIRLFFGNSMTKLPKSNFSRSIIIIWIFGSLIIDSAYQGALFHFLKG
ncbi:uncharacterized protein LOC129613307, partial [Condylostylus longicornis]|uniref:uncharacterized protein LOC129613307 n=1 Tax=Condylostylus longicornis TaxID=2530218 RepID=UPI00244E55EB